MRLRRRRRPPAITVNPVAITLDPPAPRIVGVCSACHGTVALIAGAATCPCGRTVIPSRFLRGAHVR